MALPPPTGGEMGAVYRILGPMELSAAIGYTTHDPMQTVLEQALEQYRRKQLLDAANTAYAALRAAPEAWANLEHERLAWEQTRADSLEETY